MRAKNDTVKRRALVRPGCARRRQQHRRLHFEQLEDRSMLAVLVVDSLADAPVSGFGDAPGTLRQAIFDANDTLEADEIFFAAVLDGGTIVLTEGELLVNNSLTIDGTQTATGTPLAAGVTIDAAGSDTDPDNPAGDGTRIFSIEDNFQGSPSTSTQATLVGLTLTGADSASNGGAIRSRSSGLLRIQDSTITGNVVNNRIQQSSGSVSGAAIYADGDLELINSTISNNRAYSVEEAYGGAITVGGNATIENSTLDGNILSSESNNARGGAIAALTDGTRVTITGSTLSNNLAEAFDRLAEGGAIAASEVVLENSTVSGNVANGDESTFGGTGRAGGIYAGTLAASFSTIANNRARAYTSLGYLGIADATGGGIAAFAVTLDHTIVADNLAFIVEPAGPSGVATTFGFAQNLLALEGVTDASFSLIGDDEGTGLSPSPAGGPDAQGNLIGDRQSGGIDPLLGDLADNGGPTQTHALRDFSPALDAGDFDFQPPPIFDQRGIGFDRVVNGRVDIGAFEDQEEIVLPELGSLTVNITEDIVDEFDFVTSLREAIAFANSQPGSDTVSFDAAVFAADEAIVLSGGEIEITESLVIDGTSAGGRVTIDAQQGSRIFNVTTPTGDVRLTGVTLTSGRTTGNNVSPDNTFSGGAIRSLTSGTLILEQSTIRDSTTTGDFADGGAIYAAGGVTLIDSTISGNTTSGRDSDGGGVFVRGALTLTQSTISGNRIEGASAAGGGLHATQSVVLTQSTITDNETAYIGGGLWSYIGSVDIRSTIIAGNRAALANPDLRPGTGLLSINFTLIGDSSGTSIDANSGNGNVLDVDSQLFPLADNGGPTQTHALLSTSVAVDAGDPNIQPSTNTDQRGPGFARISGNQIDIGAFEFEQLPEVDSLVVGTTEDVVNAFDNVTSLREAITFANSQPGAATVTFDPALFSSPQRISLNATLGELAVTDAVAIQGPGANLLTIDASSADPTPADNLGDGIRVLNIDDGNGGTALPVELAGFTLTGGDISGQGGAIRSLEALTIRDATISTNHAARSGGGIYARYGSLTVVDSVITGNSTNAGTGFDANGGGIAALDAALEIFGTLVSGNEAVGSGSDGGGIYAVRTAVTISDSTIAANSTNASGSDGGGIFSRNGNFLLQNSTVVNNATRNQYAPVPPSGVSVPSFGGGLSLNVDPAAGQSATILNSTITGNTSADGGGGGVFVYRGDVLIQHSTITLNTAPAGRGSGVASRSNGNVTTRIESSIVSGNTGSDVDHVMYNASDDTVNSFATNGHNLIGTGSSLPAFTANGDQTGVANPQLAPLANNGGRTQTHALLDASPAVNAGDPNSQPSTNFDQRGTGFVRVRGGRVDIGAFESDVEPLSIGDLVWLDLDNNGLFDPNEQGIAGVSLHLHRDTDGDGEFSAAIDELVATTVTDADGRYRFANLLAGDYLVRVEPPSATVGGATVGLRSSTGNDMNGRGPDPNTDIDNDDNGDPLTGAIVATRAITLAMGSEPTTDGDDANSNSTIDFGFLEAPEPPPPVTSARLTNAPGDGTVTVTLDGFGAFGTAVGGGAGEARFDPIGAEPAGSVAFESGIAIRTSSVGQRTFLAAGSIGSGGGQPPAEFTMVEPALATSSFTVGNLRFALHQQLVVMEADDERIGSRLVQTYEISNLGTETVELEIVRYFDGDLFAELGDDSGGRLIDDRGEVLFEVDTSSAAQDDETFVGITAVGGEIDPANRYEISSFSGLRRAIVAGDALANDVEGDSADSDQFIDSGIGYDVTLALRNVFSAAAGETVTYVTSTLFGTDAVVPDEDPPPTVDPPDEPPDEGEQTETPSDDFEEPPVEDPDPPVATAPPPVIVPADEGGGGNAYVYQTAAAAARRQALVFSEEELDSQLTGRPLGRPEEVSDMLFDLMDNEPIGLLGIDLGDEPIFRRPAEKQEQAPEPDTITRGQQPPETRQLMVAGPATHGSSQSAWYAVGAAAVGLGGAAAARRVWRMRRLPTRLG